MIIASSKHELKQRINDIKNTGTIAFVPTMGALHLGHLSLIEKASKYADNVIVSIFVNPKQFNDYKDYALYPKTLDADLEKIAKTKARLVYTPQEEDLYPQGFSTQISVKGLTDILCGKSRPGHFDGVALVVTKLFMQVMPDYAIFGEKDFQQLQVIKKLVHDLDINVNIIPGETIREQDGLALSSRNVRLNEKQRSIASSIFKLMTNIKDQYNKGDHDIHNLSSMGKDFLINQGFDSVDYIEILSESNLSTPTDKDDNLRIFVAATLGSCRLIDNLSLT